MAISGGYRFCQLPLYHGRAGIWQLEYFDLFPMTPKSNDFILRDNASGQEFKIPVNLQSPSTFVVLPKS